MRPLLLLLLLLAGCSKAPLTVGVAASMQDVVRQAADQFEAQGGPKVVLTAGASGALLRQVQEGAPMDVFISAGAQVMDKAVPSMVPGSRTTLAHNTLVLVTPLERGISRLEELASASRIAMGDPATVPAGTYAQEALELLGVVDVVKPHLVLGRDVRQVLTWVETGDVQAGLVYGSDAFGNARVRTVATLPTRSTMVVEGAVVAASARKDEAARFLAFLAGPAARALLAAKGFQP